MTEWARQEVEEAFRAYWTVGAIDERWEAWPDQLTEDVTYVEHIYGNMKGRETVRRWIVDVMKDNRHVHAVFGMGDDRGESGRHQYAEPVLSPRPRGRSDRLPRDHRP